MYLKNITINGFKSFPDKKEFVIDNGITGVVGPNGSGKSNVCDAVRWVLGEQSSKSLRGNKMVDVIFGGTDTRSQKSFCEVQLIFDNQSNMLSTDFAEVHISRKLYRSGESEYQINKSPARLRDILELFRDTGVGKEGYSIIGQGKIDEILTEKSTERRKIFEEAAGIMKYRVRKEEAERKLTKTKDNLLRTKDIITELETQIEPLKLQCEQAKKYIELVDEQKILEVNLYIDAYDKHSENINTIKTRINELSEEKHEIEKELALLNESEESTGMTESELDEKITSLTNNITSFQMETERLDGEINLTKHKVTVSNQEIERLNKEIENATLESAQKSDSIRDIGYKVEQKDLELEEINESIKELEQVLENKNQDQQNDALILEQVRSGVLEHLGELSDVQVDISAITSASDSAKARIEDLKQSISKNEESMQHNSDQKQKLEQAFDTLNEQSQDLSKQIHTATKDYENGEKDLSKATTELYDIEKKIEGVVSRKKLLSEMRDSFEGYYNSVRKLMKAAERNSWIGEKVISTVATAIVVPKPYETAIEIALGNAMQNIIVETDYDAKDIIDYLKKNDVGRVTFLPLNALKQRHLTDTEKQHLSMNGVVGCACDLIDYDDKVSEAINYLLSRTVIVDNMQNAIELMKRSSYSFRTVTLDGELLNPGGVITGGSLKKNQGGLLSRERLLSEMNESEARLTKKADAIRMNFILMRDNLKNTGEKRDNLDDEQRKIEIETTSIIEQLKAVTDNNKWLDEQTKVLKQEFSRLENELLSKEQQAKELLDKQSSLEHSGDKNEEKIKELADQYQLLCDEIEQIKDDLSKKNIEATSKQNEIDSLKIESNRLKTEIESLNSLCEDKQVGIAHAKSDIVHLENSILQITTNLASKKNFVQESVHNLEKLQSEKKVISDANKSRIARKEDLRDTSESISEKIHKAELSITKAESNLEYLETKTWDSYQLTYANALKFKSDEIDISKASKKIDKIKAKIRNIGEVNPHAIEDYDNLITRYDYLTKHQDDLNTAIDDLEGIIDGLMDKMKTSFAEKFNLINTNFKQVFKDLFNGGNVDLILEDKTNIMESGIQIVAQPPGKHLQNIMLMSGGEKALTAIALLFALLKINPSPLCILDEIDAALDDANTNKFADFLRTFNAETQFIVITHRKPTMSVCDVLYGLAMKEKGVTDVLSVKIS